MTVLHRRHFIRRVRLVFRERYGRYSDQFVLNPDTGKTVGDVKAALAALDLTTCSSLDCSTATGIDGCGSMYCDGCGTDSEYLVRFGQEPISDEPDGESRWQDLCRECLVQAAALLEQAPPQ